MSIDILFAIAQMMELAINRDTATSIIGLRPQMSESFAQIGPAAAFARRYALPIQVYPDAECSWAVMVGIAVATMVASSAAMNKESCSADKHVRPEEEGENARREQS
jgi:hypothetical protein